MYRPRNRPTRATIRQPQPRMASSFLVGWGGACWSGSGPRPPRATGSLRAASTPERSRDGPQGRASTQERAATLDRAGGEVAARPAGNRPVRVRVQGSRARRRRRGRSLPWATVVGVGGAAGGLVVARTGRSDLEPAASRPLELV